MILSATQAFGHQTEEPTPLLLSEGTETPRQHSGSCRCITAPAVLQEGGPVVVISRAFPQGPAPLRASHFTGGLPRPRELSLLAKVTSPDPDLILSFRPSCSSTSCATWGSVQFSRSVVSNSLRPHELQHARPPHPSPTPGVHPNSCPSSR